MDKSPFPCTVELRVVVPSYNRWGGTDWTVVASCEAPVDDIRDAHRQADALAENIARSTPKHATVRGTFVHLDRAA